MFATQKDKDKFLQMLASLVVDVKDSTDSANLALLWWGIQSQDVVLQGGLSFIDKV